MSSNIQLEKTCQFCGSKFIAKTTVTKYCGDNCAKRAYKARKRDEKIEKARVNQKQPSAGDIEPIKSKEFLNVREAALLLNCSRQAVYKMIESNRLKAVNLMERSTRIKRTDIDKLFNQK